MQKQSTIFLSLLLFNCLCAQVKYPIHYPKPTKLVIIEEYKLNNKNCYEVNFLDLAGKLVKMMRQNQAENHHLKTGYETENTIVYFFWKDSLKTSTITIDAIKHILLKHDYTYNNKGKLLGWISYSCKLKVSKDSFNNILNTDLFLNNPSAFPTKKLVMESKDIRNYDDSNRLVYICNYFRWRNMKEPVADREYFFKYNNIGQLVEYISSPTRNDLGTSSWRDTFEYNTKSDIVKIVSYEDGRHFCEDEIKHEDSLIIVTRKYDEEEVPNAPKRYSITTNVYKRRSDGNFYGESFNDKFTICPELE